MSCAVWVQCLLKRARNEQYDGDCGRRGVVVTPCVCLRASWRSSCCRPTPSWRPSETQRPSRTTTLPDLYGQNRKFLSSASILIPLQRQINSTLASLFQGKFIRINFDVAGYIVGANIETCILSQRGGVVLRNAVCQGVMVYLHWQAHSRIK